MKLTSQAYWEDHWRRVALGQAADDEDGCEIFEELSPFLPKGPDISFFEVGCAPGRMVADLCGKMGYTAYGIDYAAEPADIEAVLRKRNVKVGRIWRDDFLAWQPDRRFDVVASFGFIEHFSDRTVVELVDKHFQIAKPGGLVVLAMPNFAHGQEALHWIFDRENLKRHNTSIMTLGFLEEAARRNGAKLLDHGYAGGHFSFWIDDTRPALLRRVLSRAVPLVRILTKPILPVENRWFSPFMYGVYRVGKPDA